MEQRTYAFRIVEADGSPASGALVGVERGTAATPEVAHRATEGGVLRLCLPIGDFDLVIRTAGGRAARCTLRTAELSSRTLLTITTTQGQEVDIMSDPSSVSSEDSQSEAELGSVDNTDAAEVEVVAPEPRVLAQLPGKRGQDGPRGISARDLLVRGTKSFIRDKPIRVALESILGDDERVRILDTDGDPWRMICSLEIHGRNGAVAIGTGWFAGPKTVITAGHCVYDASSLGGWAAEIVVRPGRSGDRAPFGNLVSRRFSTTDRWKNERHPDFDYAAIHLGDDAPALTDKTGWFSTVVLNDAGLVQQRVNVSGYPGDKGFGALQGSEQWFHAKQVVHVSALRVYYDADTMPGQSGAPVWLDTPEGPRVIGIHAYGVGGAAQVGLAANSAPRITAAVLERIRGWVARP